MGMQQRSAGLARESPLRLSLKERLDTTQAIENLPAAAGRIDSIPVSK